MKVFVLFLSLCFVLNVVISPTYASEEVCTIKATCANPSTTKWMRFVTPDYTAEIESEVSLLKKTNALMESEFDKLEKEAEKNKENFDDAMKKIELLNEEVERMKKEAIESNEKMEDAMTRIVSLENENAGKKRENGGSSEKETSPTSSTSSMSSMSPMTGNENHTTTVFCPVIYENKCFIAVIERKVNYDDGVAVCKSRGGHLANIYSQTHMDDVMKYIRQNRLCGSNRPWFRLGMKYDPKVKRLTLRDGTDAPAGLKWWTGNPYSVETNAGYADYTNVLLTVSRYQSSIYQYLISQPPSSTYNVLCEIE